MKKSVSFCYKDEWWGEVYECLECGDRSIWQGFTYCPNCGMKIIWNGE